MDHVPVKFIKQLATDLNSPLTNIIDTCIETILFPWKIAKISLIPKEERPTVENNFHFRNAIENVREISAKTTGNIL